MESAVFHIYQNTADSINSEIVAERFIPTPPKVFFLSPREVGGRGAKVRGRRGELGDSGRGEEAQRAWRGGRMSLRTTQ